MSRSVPLCPHCVRPNEQPLVCDRCAWRWHANPNPTAAVLVERQADGAAEPSVLLLRRAVQPGLGAWDLPAGYVDPGESFEQAARRETLEEAGIEVELIGLNGVYHSPAANAVAAVYRGRALDPNADVTLDAESSEYAWVPRSSVPEWLPRMAFSSMASALTDWGQDRAGVPA